MRVALTCPYDWRAPGGVQVHVTQLAEELLSRGHEVLALGPGSRGPSPTAWSRNVGRPVRIAYRGTVAPIAPSPLAVRDLRAAFRAFAPDIVHVHEPFVPSTSLYATLVSPAPVVATFHARLDRSRLYEIASPLFARVALRFTAAVAVSNAAAAFVRDAVPSLEPQIIANGLDVAAFEDAAPEPLDGRPVVWVHRLDPQKGFAVMLRAWPAIVAATPDARLVVAGDGPERGLLSTLAERDRVRVTMLGAVPHARVPGLFRAAAVAVAPATGQESFGYTLVEAMAAGAPVVASDIDGYREVATDGVDALLVPPGDHGALAAAVGRVLADASLAASLVAGGRERAATFDWSIVAEQLVDTYERARRAGPSSIR